MKKLDNATYELADAVSEPLGEQTDGDFRVTRVAIHLGGQPHLKARFRTAGFDPVGHVNNQQLLEQASHAGQKPCSITVLRKTGSVVVHQGRLMRNNDRPFLLNKGSSTRGYYVDDWDVLDVIFSYSSLDAQQMAWDLMLSRVPETSKIENFDDLPVYDEEAESSPAIGAVYLLDYPDFDGGTVPGALFLATDRQPEEHEPGTQGVIVHEGIVNGYLWVPEDSGLTAEHGSQYYSRLKQLGGRVIEYRPGMLTFADCWHLPATREETYMRVLDRVSVG